MSQNLQKCEFTHYILHTAVFIHKTDSKKFQEFRGIFKERPPLHNEPNGGVRRNYVKIPKKKDLELIFAWIHIRKHDKDMPLQIK